MTIKTVAIMAPGGMGHAVGNVLKYGGLRVITTLAGRSDETARRAQKAGIDTVLDDAALVREADVILSILPPDRALDLARRLAAAIRATGAKPLYADCNAVAPATAKEIGDVVAAAGAVVADAGIIGGPPKPGPQRTRIYTSGPGAQRLAGLSAHGLDVQAIPGDVGAASALKMCYASMTKGLTAIATQSLVTARALGVSDALRGELLRSDPDHLAEIERSITQIPSKAYRFVGEMEEIAKTFASVGFSPALFESVADLYRFVAASPIGAARPEANTLSAAECVAQLADAARAERKKAAAE